MRKNSKFLAIFLIIILSVCCLITNVGCGSQNFSNIIRSVNLPESIPSVAEGEIDLDRFKEQTKTNNEHLDGLIVSPYYKVSYNASNDVFSYSTPMYSGDLHSFGYIEATEDMFPITITISSIFDNYNLISAKVIPEKLGVDATVTAGRVSFTINSFDYYTVLFNGDFNFDRPYTLMVREYEEIDVPDGYDLIEYGPGIHYVDRILPEDSNAQSLESNTMVYLHSGAYLVAKQPDLYSEKYVVTVHGTRNWDPFIWATGKENLIFAGHGVIDFSNLSLHARTPISITSCTNVRIEGITFINSMSFTLSMYDCVNINIKDVVLLGYRINSDGIVPVNCRDVLIENAFVKNGDDLCEVKATLQDAPNSKTGGTNITYRHCQAWAEKTRCFGFVQESEMDVNNLLFEDCSAIYQIAKWDDAMGAFVVCVGDSSTISDVKFINCDAYYVEGYVINICLGDNQWTLNPSKGCQGQIHDVMIENFAFHSDTLQRKHPENEKIVAFQLKNKKTVAESKISDFTGIVFKNIVMDGIVLDKLNFDDLTYYHGEVYPTGNQVNVY